MEADWYIDPLGRFEGRFFDGSRWTHQVSDRGTLAFDPDWPPVARGRSAAASDYTASEQVTASTSSEQVTASTSSVAATSTAAVATAGVGAATVGAATIDTSRTSSVAESPTRQVAVVTPETPSGRPVLASSVDRSATYTTPSEPIVRAPGERSGSGRRWLYIIGGLLLLAGLALALLPRLFGGDDTIADSDTPAVEVVQDDDAANRADQADEADEAAMADTGDEVAVGGVTIRNGQSLLGDLTAWHGEQASAKGIDLPADADCWFAKRGDVAEQAAFCGPVGVDAEGRTLYDQLAVVFDDAGPQVVSASVDRDSLIPNIALDQGRELVDRDGEIIIGGPTEPPKRGERVRGD